MTPLIFIPAAGRSSRMRGRDKLLEQVEGEALLRRQTKAAIATGCPVMVGLASGATERQAAIDGLKATELHIKDADEGMGATLRTAAFFAARHAPDRPLMILLPDVPGIGPFDLKTVITRFEQEGGTKVTRATDETGKPGTPLILPARLIPAFTTLKGDEGGKHLLGQEELVTLPLSGDRATRDLDTPEDWTAWRKETDTPK